MPDQWKGSNQILISYRRDDSSMVTGRIYDRLIDKFGRETIFKDIDSMLLGVNFHVQINQTISKCAVVLVVIGKNWLGHNNEAGKSRLDNPRDFVRIEIEAALKRDIPVIPLLVHGALLPESDSLPESLREICSRNGLQVGEDPHFHVDISRLINNLEIIMAAVPKTADSIQKNEFDTLPGSLPPELASSDPSNPQEEPKNPETKIPEADPHLTKSQQDATSQAVEKIEMEGTPKLYPVALLLGMILPSVFAIAGGFAGRRILSSPSVVISEMSGVLLAEMAAVYALVVTGFLIGWKSRKALCRVALLTSAFPLAINLGGSLALLSRGPGSDTTWFFLITAFCIMPLMPLFAYVGLHLGTLYSSRKAKRQEQSSTISRT